MLPLCPASDCLARALRILSMEGSVGLTGISLSCSRGDAQANRCVLQVEVDHVETILHALGEALLDAAVG